MMKYLYCVIVSLVASCISTSMVFAQEVDNDAMQRINSIKKSGEYVYAESTTGDWQEAYDNAKLLLIANIEDWIKRENADTLSRGCIVKASEHIVDIKTRRGDLYRAFLYVNKKDILSFTSADKVIMVPLAEDSTGNNPELLPVQNGTITIPDSPHSPMPDKDEISSYTPTEDELSMLAVTRFEEISTFMSQLKRKHRLGNYGKYVTLPKEGECFLFIYDRQGNIPAYMRRKDQKFIDVRTGNIVDISDYKNCGAIWYQINNTQL